MIHSRKKAFSIDEFAALFLSSKNSDKENN